MNTQGTAYGSYTLTKQGKWSALGRTPLETKAKYIGSFSSKEEAVKALNSFNFDFFSKHTNLLPRCVAVNRRDKKFVFTLPLEGKTQYVFQSHSLDEVVEEKLKFIMKLI